MLLKAISTARFVNLVASLSRRRPLRPVLEVGVGDGERGALLRSVLPVDCALDGVEPDDLRWTPQHERTYRRVYWTSFDRVDVVDRYALVVMSVDALVFAAEAQQIAFDRLLRQVDDALLLVGDDGLRVADLPAWLRDYEPSNNGGVVSFAAGAAAEVVDANGTISRDGSLGLVEGARLVLATNGRRFIDFKVSRHPWSAVLEIHDAKGTLLCQHLLYDESGAPPELITVDTRHSPTLELRVRAHAPARGTEAWLMSLESLTCA